MFLEEIINLSIALTSKINIGLFDQIPSFVFEIVDEAALLSCVTPLEIKKYRK